MQSFFVYADKLLAIFEDIKYSLSGTSDKKKEVDTYLLFVDFLDECERGTWA